MADTSKSEEPVRPLEKPSRAFENLITYVEETRQLYSLSRFAISELSGLAALAKALKKDQEAVDQAKQIERLAEAEVSRGFPLLTAHTLVSIWGALRGRISRVLREVAYLQSRIAQ